MKYKYNNMNNPRHNKYDSKIYKWQTDLSVLNLHHVKYKFKKNIYKLSVGPWLKERNEKQNNSFVEKFIQ